MSMRTSLLANCVALAALQIAALQTGRSQFVESSVKNQAVVPQVMRYAGVAQNRAGDSVEALFRIYASQEGGEPLWSESQRMTVGADQKYSVLLGAATDGGLPQTVFASGEARWLGISIEGAPELARVPLASVAYAMKAADAETLAGLPAAEFVTQAQLRAKAAESMAPEMALDKTQGTVHATVAPTGSGTAGTIPLWSASSVLGNSALKQTGTNVTAAGSISGQSKTIAAAITGTNTAATGAATGVSGKASSITQNSAAVDGYENAASGEVYGVIGGAISTTTGASGVYGYENGKTGDVYGVTGSAISPTNDAAGVFGNEQSLTGEVYGVSGKAASKTLNAAGVYGLESATTGQVYGVSGLTNSTTAYAAGVYGHEGAATGYVAGVIGSTPSTTDGATGVFGYEGATTGEVSGLFGSTASTTDYSIGAGGYEGAATGQVFGVGGTAVSTTTFAAGVSGYESAATGMVFGVAGNAGSTTTGASGVAGYENAMTGQVYGVTGGTASPTTGAAGVSGTETSTTGLVYGVSGTSASQTGVGVYGTATAATGTSYGVEGSSASEQGVGVYGFGQTGGVRGITTLPNTLLTGLTYGVFGEASALSGNAVGVLGVTASSGGSGGSFANSSGSGLVLQGLSGQNSTQVFSVDASGNGTFAGNLAVTGSVSKGSGSFKIDHPLDPADKYLYHSFVESPDMMNVYNGNITTDKHGVATVMLPDYFDALNRDFRYQLTVIGQFAQAIVATKIANNRFVIRTSRPKVEVSWQVTGIRQDAYANANRILVEVDKPEAERGYYLHPEVFGQPADKSIANAGRRTPAQNEGTPGSR